ncbi:glycosyltransferase family 2 protein [Lacticaseibacillus parakribbianus]|uniref:glycosyltransferase family 2 protein n=1 Tax=Lacticaseibacillus parakribbianus TaxID=2970927 RepID=UPI0021CB557F|nr:glycosyltransferase family 2 protein [Lacticaseibacillus parakribbianus]
MLSIIVPCFNEEETVPRFFEAVEAQRLALAETLEYVFVNDGSTDQTLARLRELAAAHQNVHYVSFSRNFGKEAALYAGLQQAKGQLVVVMDADLQDPPALLPQMQAMLRQNPDLDCVGTRRTDRKSEPPVRSFFARAFYRLINRISQTPMVDGVRDFRMMTRPMVDAILALTEYNRFSKGLFSWVGFNVAYISYENQARVAGKSSWSFWKLFNYSIEGIVNFSELPLNLASVVGALSCVGSGIAMLFIIGRALLYGDPTAGWPSLVSIVLFIGGIQLLCLGIIGKYIGKIFLETKNRPLYIIKETDESEAHQWHV